MIGLIGNVGRPGLFGRPLRRVASGPDFTLSNAGVSTFWGSAIIGDLIPSGAPVGAYFVIVGEPAGLAVVNG